MFLIRRSWIILACPVLNRASIILSFIFIRRNYLKTELNLNLKFHLLKLNLMYPLWVFFCSNFSCA